MENNQEEKLWCVYKHTNKVNGKIYIGQAKGNPEYRWNHGLGYKQSQYFWNAIQKYGWDNFEHEILFNNLTLDEANELEAKLIADFNATDRNVGYNIKQGGKNGCHSEETKQKISEAIKGENHPLYGKTRESSPNWGRHQSIDTKIKISNAHMGLKPSEETRQKLKSNHANFSGENHPQYGTHRSEETKQKLCIANGTKVQCVETGTVYNSAREVYRLLGIDASSVSRCCNPKAKRKMNTAGGYHWRYVD